MKKFLTIMTAAAVLLCGTVLTGCGLKEVVSDSYNQWYKYKSNTPLNIPVLTDDTRQDLDTTSESSQYLQNAELYFYYNPDNGLKVAVQTTSTQEVSMLNGLYSQQMKVVMGGTKQYAPEDFGSVKWTALWTSGKIEKSDEPQISAHPDQCILLNGLTDDGNGNHPKIQWRKFLANYLLTVLIGE